MRPARTIACAVLTLLVAPRPGPAQDVEPYQFLFATVGFGAIRPTEEESGLRPADGGSGVQLGLGLDVRRTSAVALYIRADADAARIRQHLGLTGGVRVRFRRSGRLQPYGSLGGGLYWLVPRTDVSAVLDRTFGLRVDGGVGAELSASRDLRWFAEYRLSGGRFEAVRLREDCSGPTVTCLVPSSTQALHLGHAGWVGFRLKVF